MKEQRRCRYCHHRVRANSPPGAYCDACEKDMALVGGKWISNGKGIQVWHPSRLRSRE